MTNAFQSLFTKWLLSSCTEVQRNQKMPTYLQRAISSQAVRGTAASGAAEATSKEQQKPARSKHWSDAFPLICPSEKFPGEQHNQSPASDISPVFPARLTQYPLLILSFLAIVWPFVVKLVDEDERQRTVFWTLSRQIRFDWSVWDRLCTLFHSNGKAARYSEQRGGGR